MMNSLIMNWTLRINLKKTQKSSEQLFRVEQNDFFFCFSSFETFIDKFDASIWIFVNLSILLNKWITVLSTYKQNVKFMVLDLFHGLERVSLDVKMHSSNERKCFEMGSLFSDQNNRAKITVGSACLWNVSNSKRREKIR